MSFDLRRQRLLMTLAVSIPLEQGSVFRQALTYSLSKKVSLNPFGTGQCLSTKISCLDGRACEVSIPLEQGSVFRQRKESIPLLPECLNPFGTGQCLSTAVVFWSLVAQGLREPLPNFFRDSESWVLIWLNVVQVLTFYSLIKRSKTEGILPEFLDFTSLNSLKIPNKS